MGRCVKRAVWGIIAGLVLAGCGGAVETPAGGAATQPGQAAPSEGPPTDTPLPPHEIVICAGARPDSLSDGSDPAAAALWRLVAPQAVVYGTGYTASSDLLAALPSTADGSLRRTDDGSLAVTLRYRDDLVWSDGEPFDAADALLGLQLPGYAVLDARQIDSHRLAVTLPPNAPYPYVPTQPPLPAHALGEDFDPAALAEADLLDPTLGPYVYAGGDQETLHFAVNAHYPGAEGLAPAVALRFVGDPAQIASELASGGCDAALDGSFGLEQASALAASGARVYAIPGPAIEQLIFNTYTADTGRAPLFADVRVRQAAAQAIDRAGLAALAWGDLAGEAGVPDSWLPADHWAFPGAERLTRYSMDVTAAAGLLDAAGWRDTDGDGVREYHGEGGAYSCGRGEWAIEEGTPLAPVLVIPSGDDLRARMAEQIAQALASIGMRVEVKAEAPDVLYSADGPLVRRGFDLALLAGLAAPDPDGVSRWVGSEVFRQPLTGEPVHRWELEERWLRTEQMVERLAYSNVPGADNLYQGQNFAGWCNEAADLAIVRASLLALDAADKQPAYAEQQAHLSADLPALPLFARPRLAASSSKLCGVAAGPVDPLTWNVTAWTYSESGTCPQ